jgi:hypothetical protein
MLLNETRKDKFLDLASGPRIRHYPVGYCPRKELPQDYFWKVNVCY